MAWPYVDPRSSGGLQPKGQVDGCEFAFSPATGTPCVAYVLELHWQDARVSRLTFRDAVSVGFDVVLDDGRRARIPPGEIQLAGELPQMIDVDNPRLEAHLQATAPQKTDMDPGGERNWGGDSEVFRYNIVREAVIIPGDIVSLVSPFQPIVNAVADTPGYREPMPSLLVPVGVAVIQLGKVV